jgi:hypothetical protein
LLKTRDEMGFLRITDSTGNVVFDSKEDETTTLIRDFVVSHIPTQAPPVVPLIPTVELTPEEIERLEWEEIRREKIAWNYQDFDEFDDDEEEEDLEDEE